MGEIIMFYRTDSVWKTKQKVKEWIVKDELVHLFVKTTKSKTLLTNYLTLAMRKYLYRYLSIPITPYNNSIHIMTICREYYNNLSFYSNIDIQFSELDNVYLMFFSLYSTLYKRDYNKLAKDLKDCRKAKIIKDTLK